MLVFKLNHVDKRDTPTPRGDRGVCMETLHARVNIWLASLISPWLLWWPPAESHYNIYDHSVVGYVSHAHSIVLLYSVGNKITTTTTSAVTNEFSLPNDEAMKSYCVTVITNRSRSFLLWQDNIVWFNMEYKKFVVNDKLFDTMRDLWVAFI